ncbi:hypothetical protein HMPREF9022_01094 [Erysipelotrichaceae bacterium 2_2_44A]|nr:hypothetical protein HMPREF9022_01094 [Erysipelotrichaceae bacterium 2_2_44A]
MKKILSVVFCSLLAFSMNSFTGAKAEENDMLYFKTIKSEVADTYAKETVYDFLIAENTIKPILNEKITMGQGIYVQETSNESIPTYYYPIYIDNKLTYVYRIFDDGTGNYTGIFSENFVDDLTKYAGNTPEDAPIISLDPQNNQELFISDNGTTIVNSKTGSVEAFRTKAEFRSASAFKPVDISDKTSFFVKPQTRATSYNYMLNINIVETQGSTNWSFAYVTATALRYKGKNVRASTITNYFNLGTQTALSVDNAKKYCKTKGVTYDGRYSGSIMNSSLHGYLRGAIRYIGLWMYQEEVIMLYLFMV